VALWAGTVVLLSSLSGRTIEELNPFELSDKVVHFLAFLVGGILLSLALRGEVTWSWRRIALVAILAISAFGALDEWHQLHTPYRTGADPFDWLADTLGAITGAVVASPIYARVSRRARAAQTAD